MILAIPFIIIIAISTQPCDTACFNKKIDKKTFEYKDSSYPGWQRIEDGYGRK